MYKTATFITYGFKELEERINNFLENDAVLPISISHQFNNRTEQYSCIVLYQIKSAEEQCINVQAN